MASKQHFESERKFLREFGHLKRDTRYRVVREFTDYDGGIHPVGEAWTFVGSNFVPYEDGLTLYAVNDDESERKIRMQFRPEEQGPILNVFEEYVRQFDYE